MPKVLQVNSGINWGSTGRIAEGIGLEAMEQGWDSYIAYANSHTPSESHAIHIGSKYNFYIHAFQTRVFDRQGLSSKNATKEFIKRVEEIRPDVIHLHNIHGYYLNYPLFFEYLKERQYPVFWTLHDCWPFTGHCSHFIGCGCERWKTGCFNCPQKRAYPSSYVFDRSRKNYLDKRASFTSIENLTLIPVSSWLSNLIQESFFKRKKIHVIHNGVDLNTFKVKNNRNQVCSKYGINPNKKIILGVASVWDKCKGLDDFMKLRELLSDEYTIVTVGVAKEQIAKFPTGMIGISRTNNVDDLANLYSASHVFLNPTYVDNFPTTNIEALACGCPVITYKTGGSPEAIDSRTGRVCEQGDVHSLAGLVKEIAESPNHIDFRMSARQRVMQCFDKKVKFLEYVKLYNESILL